MRIASVIVLTLTMARLVVNVTGRRSDPVRAAMATSLLCLAATAAFAQDPAAQRGRTFAQANCSGCHAIGPAGQSPLPLAPPFRTLHQRYPVESLTEAF